MAIERHDRGVDVVVIGGGIIGCAAAAMLATRGARVALVERSEIGAGASGRNLGAVQHPFDPVLAPLYLESLSRYRALAELSAGAFAIGAEPAGLLLLTPDADAASRQVARFGREVPELEPRLLDPGEVVEIEPSLARGPWAVRLATGFPIPPASATEAWASLAARRGAEIVVGLAARPRLDGERVTGVDLADGSSIAAGAVLAAAGPWTPPLVDPTGAWLPIRSTYGVTLQLRLGVAAPRHVVEEDAVDSVNRAQAATEEALAAADASEAEPPSLFSIASAGGISTLGSTFLPERPDPAAVEPILLRRGATFLPAISTADVVGRRLCARPQSVDGRPFIGPVAGIDGLFVCAGHGPWGISTGPASAALAARAVLDGTRPPPELAATRPI
jgi:glycine/D-amino acid oxidase-like deaminating enzyme